MSLDECDGHTVTLLLSVILPLVLCLAGRSWQLKSEELHYSGRAGATSIKTHHSRQGGGSSRKNQENKYDLNCITIGTEGILLGNMSELWAPVNRLMSEIAPLCNVSTA